MARQTGRWILVAAAILGITACTSDQLEARVISSPSPSPSQTSEAGGVPVPEVAPSAPPAVSPEASGATSSSSSSPSSSPDGGESSVIVEQSNSSTVTVNGSSTTSVVSSSCSARISNPKPGEDGSETIYVTSNVPHGGVMVIVHYEDANRTFTSTTDAAGKATITFSTDKAEAGYVVEIDVSINGQARCQTSFTSR